MLNTSFRRREFHDALIGVEKKFANETLPLQLGRLNIVKYY